MSFESFNLNPSVLAGVQALGFTKPTPIQSKAIPPIMQGRDIIGLAQTGTGKTAAFVLPILHRLMEGPRGVVRALIVAPTRELAEQTCESVATLGKNTRLRGVAVYGGVGIDQQKRQIKAGAEIVVACPGRLLDHLWQGTINLSHLEVLVIDEADRMFDMGFLPDIRNILKCIMKPRQTLLFSATMPNDINKLVQEVLRNPVTVQIGRSAPASTVKHALYPVKQHLKSALLLSLLRNLESESVLIFTRTKIRAERVCDQLKRSGYSATALQGNMSQYNRQDALDSFRGGYSKILVATDIAARGLDVLSISHVINYDMPECADDYIHRIGRTGRVEKSGEAFTLVTTEDVKMVHELEKILKATIEKRTVPDFDYDKPAEAARRQIHGMPRSPGRSSSPQRRSSGQSGRPSGPSGRSSSPPRRPSAGTSNRARARERVGSR